MSGRLSHTQRENCNRKMHLCNCCNMRQLRLLVCRRSDAGTAGTQEAAHARGDRRAAFALFDERGFDATTIADIAAAADIAPRTFFAYFPSKEDVVFADFPETVEGLARQLDDRAEDETAIDAIRVWIEGKLDEVDLRDEQELPQARDRAESPALADHYRALMGQIEELLAGHIARDLGDEARRHPAAHDRLVGDRHAVGARRKGRRRRSPPTKQEALAMVDEALTFLQGGLDALRRPLLLSSRVRIDSAIRASSCSTDQLGSRWWATLTSAEVGSGGGSGQLSGSQSLERMNALGQWA